MTVGAGLNNSGQTYGNGEVCIKGAFTDSGSAAVLAHGKGFTVARTAQAGCYLVTLQQSFKAILASGAALNPPASQGTTALSHPGFAICGDLQSNANQFYIYTYAFGGTQQFVSSVSTTTLCEFELIASMSALNA